MINNNEHNNNNNNNSNNNNNNNNIYIYIYLRFFLAWNRKTMFSKFLPVISRNQMPCWKKPLYFERTFNFLATEKEVLFGGCRYIYIYIYVYIYIHYILYTYLAAPHFCWNLHSFLVYAEVCNVAEHGTACSLRRHTMEPLTSQAGTFSANLVVRNR